MIKGKRVLAIVPARSGSKGVPHKNMCLVAGLTLIGRAGEVLRRTTTVDRAVITTDSPEYAREGTRHGLDSWFLRPIYLSHDTASAVETTIHALHEAEPHYGEIFEIILIIEPTSPLRSPEDIDGCVQALDASGADSVVSVSKLDPKFHPRKLLLVRNGRLDFYRSDGAAVIARQELEGEYYYRNGICYALTRTALLNKRSIFLDKTLPYFIERPIVNVDESFELKLAGLLLEDLDRRQQFEPKPQA